jgi:hypothetical protein
MVKEYVFLSLTIQPDLGHMNVYVILVCWVKHVKQRFFLANKIVQIMVCAKMESVCVLLDGKVQFAQFLLTQQQKRLSAVHSIAQIMDVAT